MCRNYCYSISSMGRRKRANNVVIKIGELIDVEICEDDISVCHRLPVSRNHDGRRKQKRIIAKFVRREIKEKLYKSRQRLNDETTNLRISAMK